MSTIRDVAAAAGVSVATVSRLLNSEGNVRPETAERVREAIRALNYTPNLLGRNLRQGETRKIIVLLNTISNQYYSRVVKGIEECARRRNYTVMVCMTHGDPALESSFLNLLKTRLVDGAILLTIEQDGAVLSEALAGLPVVQACEPKPDLDAPSVTIDNECAAYEATRYLFAKGHRRIAFFGASGIYDSSRKREAGFRRAFAEEGLPVEEALIFNEGFSVNAGIRAAERMLRLPGRLPDAVFCISDSAAAGAIRTLMGRGIRVPEDISVMGFDNTQIAEVFCPSITTTGQPQYDIGYRAMEQLLCRMDKTALPQEKLILSHEILERDSVAARQ